MRHLGKYKCWIIDDIDELLLSFRYNNSVVESKFVCLTHSEAKQTELSEFGAEKGILVEEVPTWKMGGLDWSQLHLAGWPGCKVADFLAPSRHSVCHW